MRASLFALPYWAPFAFCGFVPAGAGSIFPLAIGGSGWGGIMRGCGCSGGGNSVTFTTGNGTAVAGSDYQAISATRKLP